jgi:predicted aconitase
MNYYEKCKEIVANMQAERIDGMWVDISSANIYCQVYENIKPTNQELLEGMAIDKAMRIVWDIASTNN